MFRRTIAYLCKLKYRDVMHVPQRDKRALNCWMRSSEFRCSVYILCCERAKLKRTQEAHTYTHSYMWQPHECKCSACEVKAERSISWDERLTLQTNISECMQDTSRCETKDNCVGQYTNRLLNQDSWSSYSVHLTLQSVHKLETV